MEPEHVERSERVDVDEAGTRMWIDGWAERDLNVVRYVWLVIFLSLLVLVVMGLLNQPTIIEIPHGPPLVE